MAKINVPELQKNSRLADHDRHRVGEQLLREYNTGKSIRTLCGETGYSIGRVRRLLEEVGVTYRSRGGARRTQNR